MQKYIFSFKKLYKPNEIVIGAAMTIDDERREAFLLCPDIIKNLDYDHNNMTSKKRH
jgi:hypothetical protein